MSCMVIDERSLISAARTINASKYSLPVYHSHALEALHEKLCYWARVEFLDDALTKLTRLAFIINHKAYRERYTHNQDAKFCAPYRLPLVTSMKVPSANIEASLFQALKTLQFLEYQCLDVSHKDKLRFETFFTNLKEAQALLTRALIENSPLYKAANWS